VKDVKEIIDLMNSPLEEEVTLITKAFNFAQKAHGSQKRFSGEPYFHHLAESAKILAEQGMDAPTIAAGLLHDTMEDLGVTSREIETEFNKEVVFLVKGVTKLGKLKYRGLERHAESLRKLFVATSQDIRVLIIKLADRVHNVSTLEHVHPEKQKRIALETLEIYAPLANRLGMGNLKAKLEDYSFPYAHPEEYRKVKKLLKQKRKSNLKSLEKIYRTIKTELVKQDIKNIKVDYRLKNIFSLYKKLLKRDMDMDRIYDIVALRIIAPDVTKAKQTETTQRFKIHLLTAAGEDLFTKIEFLRRGLKGSQVVEAVSNKILRAYKMAPLLVSPFLIMVADILHQNLSPLDFFRKRSVSNFPVASNALRPSLLHAS